MSDQHSNGKSPPESDKGKIAQSPETTAAAKLPPDSEEASLASTEPSTPKKLTAEEQMALYEKELKEDDWGHQPC